MQANTLHYTLIRKKLLDEVLSSFSKTDTYSIFFAFLQPLVLFASPDPTHRKYPHEARLCHGNITQGRSERFRVWVGVIHAWVFDAASMSHSQQCPKVM